MNKTYQGMVPQAEQCCGVLNDIRDSFGSGRLVFAVRLIVTDFFEEDPEKSRQNCVDYNRGVELTSQVW